MPSTRASTRSPGLRRHARGSGGRLVARDLHAQGFSVGFGAGALDHGRIGHGVAIDKAGERGRRHRIGHKADGLEFLGNFSLPEHIVF